MAELAGSIIGIVSAGTKVALVLSQLAADMGSAGQEARMISSEIRTFCTILNTLKDTLEKIQNSNYYAHCFDMVQGMTAASIDMFTEVLNAAETLSTLATGKYGRDKKFTFVNKMQWVVFQKPKIIVLRAAIEAYKSNIAMMLGTVNIVEKVARRSSNPTASTTVAEDDQEQATLQGLDLDCRSSMISLEEAERQYQESLTKQDRSSDLQPTLHDLAIDTEPGTNWESNQDNDGPQIRLLRNAREDVNSIRSSLKSNSNDEETLQARLARHSQRLSALTADDHKRLSQRWSRPPGDETSLIDRIHHDKHRSSVGQDSASHDQLVSLKHPEQQALFMKFRDWLLNQPWSQQDAILTSLRSAMYSDRVETGQLNVADVDILAPNAISRSSDRVKLPDSGSEKSAWKKTRIPQQVTHDITQAISEQLSPNARQWSSSASPSNGCRVSLTMRNISELPESAIEALMHKDVKAIELSWNHLRTIPQSFCFCKHLRIVDLGNNWLEVFPEPLLHLSALVALDIRGNKIRCIPSGVSNLKALEVLFLSDNKLQGVPFAIGSMEKLKILDLRGNTIMFPVLSAFHDRIEDYYDTLGPPRFNTAHTAMLKFELKHFEMDQLTHANVQAISGTLPPDAQAAHLASRPASFNEFETLIWGHGEVEEATSIEEAMAFLKETTKDIVEPPSEVVYEIPIPPTRPRIQIHKAGNSSVSFPAKRGDGHDHRRSRSHDISSSGSQSFATRSASSLHPSQDTWGRRSPEFLEPRTTTQERQFSFRYMPQFR